MTEHNREWTVFGRYVLLEKVGTGGMAEIYRAKTFGAAGFEKEFAIKLILPNLINDAEFVDMFIHEAKITVNLYHTNVVQIFDLGQFDGQYFIAMEYVHGKDLLDVLARCAEHDLKIPLDLVLFLTMELLKGLDFAHRAKDPFGEDLDIIHRDISPSNILISYSGDVKVGDFGVAKAAIKRGLSDSGTLKGKVGYMSPEQVMGERIDSRSDVFSAGIVFFEALTMTRLFAGGSDLDIMLRVRDADVDASLRRVNPLPADLAEIVGRALARHREERYQTAGEFYQALMDFCFRHNVKVSSADLSNFMTRLFAREIEVEKARRRADPQAFHMRGLLHRDETLEPTMGMGAASNLSEGAAHASAHEPISVELDSPVLHDALATSEGEDTGRGVRYRYRDRHGMVYGPISLRTLKEFVKNQPPQPGDRISVNNGPWLRPHELDELRGLVEVVDSEPRNEPTRHEPTRHEPTRHEPTRHEPTREPTRRHSTVRPSTETQESADPLSSSLIHDPSPTPTQTSAPRPAPGAAIMGFSRRSSTAPTPTPPPPGPKAEELVQEIREQYASYEGELADASIARLLARLHRSKSTGRLLVHNNQDIEKSIFFKSGELILVNSNRKEELLGNFLLDRDLIAPEQLDEAFQRLSEWGGRLGDALVAIGALQAHDIFTLLSEQMREKLLEIFSWREGHYGYFENQEPETLGYPLDVDCYETISRGCRERVSFARLLNFYNDRQNTPITALASAPVSTAELRLTTAELRVVKAIEQHGPLSMRELLRHFSPNQREEIYRTVYLLHQVEHVAYADTRPVALPA